MTACDETQVRDQLRRLDALITALDERPDPAARELVALVLDLHGLGLARLMALLSKMQDNDAIMARLVEDEQVRAMLLLHGLHPEDLDTRVRRAVERLTPHLGVHGLRIEIVEIAGGAVRLRVHGAEHAKAAVLWTLPAEIENAIVEAAPDLERVAIDGLEPVATPRRSLAAENQAAE